MDRAISRKFFNFIYIIVLCIMFIFNFLTPMVSDDYAHYYGTEDVHPQNLGEIIKNMTHFRIDINGRVFSHFLIYIFLSLPRIVFQICNAGVSAFLVYFISKYFVKKNNIKELILVLFYAAAIWVFTPSFGEIYLWLSGAINYSWGLALDLLLIYPFYCNYMRIDCKMMHREKILLRVCFVILAFIVGAYSENGATATICVIGLLGLLILIQKKEFPVFLFVVFCCTCAGYLFLITAPATINGRIGGDIREHIWYCRVLTRKHMTVLFFTYALLLTLAIKFKINKKVVFFSLVLLVGSLLSIIVFIFAIYLPPRSFMIAVTFTILAQICLLSELLEKDRIPILGSIPGIIIIAFCVIFPKGMKDIFYLHRLQNEREVIIEESIDRNVYDVTLPRFVTFTDYTACPEEDLSIDSTYWYNNLLSRYYGLHSISAEKEK